MIRRIRDYLYKRFLPWVTREEYQREIQQLRRAFDAVQAENRELKAYINGVQDSIKMRAKIEIKNEVNKNEP